MKITTSIHTIWYLRNAEHYEFHQGVINFLDKQPVVLTHFNESFQVYKDLFKQEKRIFKSNGKQAETDNIKEIDKSRLHDIRSLFYQIKAAYHSVEPEKSKYGEFLFILTDTYKKIHKVSYNSRTAYITNLLNDLHQPQNRKAVEILQLDNLESTLKAKNQAFIDLFQNRKTGSYIQYKKGNMKWIKPRVNYAFREIADQIESMFLLSDKVLKNGEMAKILYILIDEINSQIKAVKHTITTG